MPLPSILRNLSSKEPFLFFDFGIVLLFMVIIGKIYSYKSRLSILSLFTMKNLYIKQTQTQKVIGFLLPTGLETIVYILSAFVVLCVINVGRLWREWSNGVSISPETADQSLSKTLESVDLITTSPLLGDIFVILFWAALGSVVYMAIWFTHNSLIEVKREAVGQHISGDMKKRNYLSSLLAHYIFFLTLLILTKAALYIVCFVLLPIINAVFYGTMVNLGSLTLSDALWGIASVLLLALIFHGLRLLAQIYSRFWRMYIRAQ